MTTVEHCCRVTYPENHWNREAYQGIAKYQCKDDGRRCGKQGGTPDHGSPRHMLLPGLRPLARRQARSVSLQFQHRLISTSTGPYKFSDFLSWARKTQESRQLEQSQPRSGSGNAQGDKPPKTRGVKKRKRLDSSRPKHKNSLKGRTREERILETVATVGGEKSLNPVASSWPGENWKAENWGLDSGFPSLGISFRRAN